MKAKINQNPINILVCENQSKPNQFKSNQIQPKSTQINTNHKKNQQNPRQASQPSQASQASPGRFAEPRSPPPQGGPVGDHRERKRCHTTMTSQ